MPPKRGVNSAARAAAARARWSRRASQSPPKAQRQDDSLTLVGASQMAEQSQDDVDMAEAEQEAEDEEEEPPIPIPKDDVDADPDVEDPSEEDAAEEGQPEPESTTPVPRKRGRPPKRPGWDDPGKDDGSDGQIRQRKPRGGYRGRARGRGRGAHLMSQTTRVAIDKEGTEAEVVDDEVQLPEDPEGETKVDKNGFLQGGREYRVRTFSLLGRGEKLYMLSTEPARCTGFRDSYLFFTKHLTLFKVLIGDDEKRDLIARDLLPHSYKGRSIGVVTARSVFREFGARIVVGGKKVIDDYRAQAARERGEVEGELADPYDKLPEPGEDYNRNQYVAWHGASAVYHSDRPTVPMPNGQPVKRKMPVTATNWMYQHAVEAARFNADIGVLRRQNRQGVYDPHTNAMLLPKNFQPTHLRWERIGSTQTRPTSEASVVTNGHTNGDYQAHINGAGHMSAPATSTSVQNDGRSFPAISDTVARNYLVIDSYFQSPPHASWPTPGRSPFTEQEHEQFEIPKPGLPDLTAEELADLPEDCRAALFDAKADQQRWVDAFGSESTHAGRAQLRPGVGAF